jgi:hypothetical protein
MSRPLRWTACAMAAATLVTSVTGIVVSAVAVSQGADQPVPPVGLAVFLVAVLAPASEAGRAVRQGPEPAALRLPGARAAATVLDVLGGPARVALPRRAGDARPRPRRGCAAAPAGPLAGLRRAPRAALARRRLALVAAHRIDGSDRRDRAGGVPGVARSGGRDRGDPPRPLRHRSVAQPDAGLRRAHRPARRDVRGGRAAGGPHGRRLGVVGVAGDARRRTGLPAAARPRPRPRRPALRAGATGRSSAKDGCPRRSPATSSTSTRSTTSATTASTRSAPR